MASWYEQRQKALQQYKDQHSAGGSTIPGKKEPTTGDLIAKGQAGTLTDEDREALRAAGVDPDRRDAATAGQPMTEEDRANVLHGGAKDPSGRDPNLGALPHRDYSGSGTKLGNLAGEMKNIQRQQYRPDQAAWTDDLAFGANQSIQPYLQGVGDMNPYSGYYQDASQQALQGRSQYQMPALDQLQRYAAGEDSIVAEQNRLNRQMLGQQLYAGLATGKYDPNRQRMLTQNYLQGATQMGRQGEIAAMQERQQALQNLITGAGAVRGQDMQATAQAQAEAQAMRGFDMNRQALTQKYLEMGFGADAANQAAEQELQRLLMAQRENELGIASAALTQQEVPRKSGWEKFIQGAQGIASIAGAGASLIGAFSDPKTKKNTKYITASPGQLKQNVTSQSPRMADEQSPIATPGGERRAQGIGQAIQRANQNSRILRSSADDDERFTRTDTNRGYGMTPWDLPSVYKSQRGFNPLTLFNNTMADEQGNIQRLRNPNWRDPSPEPRPPAQQLTPPQPSFRVPEGADLRAKLAMPSEPSYQLSQPVSTRRSQSDIDPLAARKIQALRSQPTPTPVQLTTPIEAAQAQQAAPTAGIDSNLAAGKIAALSAPQPVAPTPVQLATPIMPRSSNTAMLSRMSPRLSTRRRFSLAPTTTATSANIGSTLPSSRFAISDPKSKKGVVEAGFGRFAKGDSLENLKSRIVNDEKLTQQDWYDFLTKVKVARVHGTQTGANINLLAPVGSNPGMAGLLAGFDTAVRNPGVIATSPEEIRGNITASPGQLKKNVLEDPSLQTWLDTLSSAIGQPAQAMGLNPVQQFEPMEITLSDAQDPTDTALAQQSIETRPQEVVAPQPVSVSKPEPIEQDDGEDAYAANRAEMDMIREEDGLPGPESEGLVFPDAYPGPQGPEQPMGPPERLGDRQPQMDEDRWLVSQWKPQPGLGQTHGQQAWQMEKKPGMSKADMISAIDLGFKGLGQLGGAFGETYAERMRRYQLEQAAAQEANRQASAIRRQYISGLMGQQGATRSAIALSDPRTKNTSSDGDALLQDYLDKVKPVQFEYKNPGKYGAGRRTGVMSTDIAKSALGDAMVVEDPETGYKMLQQDPRIMNPLLMASDALLNQRVNQLEELLTGRNNSNPNVEGVNREDAISSYVRGTRKLTKPRG